MELISKLKKRREIEKWMGEKGEFYLTELIVKCHGWTCECCGSDKDLDAYHFVESETCDDGHVVVNSCNENLICLCPSCYKKYHNDAVEALRHMTNPQIFKTPESDPRIKKYCGKQDV